MEMTKKKKRPRNHNPQPFLAADHESVVSSKKRSRGAKKHQEEEKLISSVITSKILKQALIQQKEIQDEDDERHHQNSGLKLKFPEQLGAKLNADEEDDDDVDHFNGFSETQSQFGNYEEEFDEDDNNARSVSPSVGSHSDDLAHQSRRTPTYPTSSKTIGKRKSTGDSYSQEFIEKITSSIAELCRAIVESAVIIAGRVRREHPKSSDIFVALSELKLAGDYMLECYEYLADNDAKAELFLGSTPEFRHEVLELIMNSK